MLAFFFAMGIGLLLVGLAGMGKHVPDWAAWSTFGLGVASMVAGAVRFELHSRRMAWPLTFFVLLELLWVVELATGVPGWFTWMSFGAGFLYLAAVLTAGSPRHLLRPHTPLPAH